MNALTGSRRGSQLLVAPVTAPLLEATLAETRNCLTVMRVVIATSLVSLLWKIGFFALAARVYFRLPMEDPFFPLWLQSPLVSCGAFLVSVLALVAMLVSPDARRMARLGWLPVAGLGVLCIHQQAYNDMTFFTSWWTAVWIQWMAMRTIRQPLGQWQRGAFLAQLLLSMILFGGGVGKLTPGFWSGEVFFEIYFSGRDYWVFNLLRNQLDEDSLRQLACGYARMVTITELACGGLWLLPVRLASWLALAVLLGIALLSNTWLFSVLSCLMGLALVGLHQPRVADATG